MNPGEFILSHTRLQRPTSVPELQLYLADEVIPFWKLVEQEQGEGVPPPFWAFAWVGGLAIARYILDNPEVVASKRVLDFATGSGLCAIAASLAGAPHVLASDTDPWTGAAVALNAKANNVEIGYTSRNLLRSEPPRVGLILAGDVCYEEPMAADVMAWLEAAHHRGIQVLIGDPGRSHFPRERLRQLAEYAIPTTRELEDRDIKPTGVYTFPG